MNIDQWVLQVSEAYQAIGLPFSPDKKAFLLANLPDRTTETQKKVMAEAYEVMIRYFFKKASRGETFGPLNRIKEQFGRSLEEIYGLSSGPFINMAKTYWTYKLEVSDLVIEYHSLAISQMLYELEFSIAGLFFPTRGPWFLELKKRVTLPVSKRRKAQREVLQEFAPEIDIDIFLGNNPILGTSLQDS